MKLFTSNATTYRLIRTIIQGIIGVVVASLDVFIGKLTISPEMKPVIVAVVMAILSPIMAELGKIDKTENE